MSTHDHLAYRVRILPHQMARARERLTHLLSEAVTYRMFDELTVEDRAFLRALDVNLPPSSDHPPLGRSGAARVAPTRGAIGGER